MLIDINSTCENTSPFMGIHYDIENSFSLIESLISDVKLLVDQKEKKLKESIMPLYSERSYQLDEINHQNEKIDIFINQMNLSYNIGSFLLLVAQLENILKEIYELCEVVLPKQSIKFKYKKDDPFGLNWKNKFDNVLKTNVNEQFYQEWEILTCIYNIRSKIAHKNSVISNDLKNSIDQFRFAGIKCSNNNCSTNYSITISSLFISDIIQRISLFLKDLLQSVFESSISSQTN